MEVRDPGPSYVVILTCERKLIKSRLADGLKVVTFYLSLISPEKLLAKSRGLKTSRV